MKLFIFLILASSCSAISCNAMTHDEHHSSMTMHGMYGTYPMSRESTGTSWMPSSTQMPEIHRIVDDWVMMIDGYLMAIYDDQGGRRGDRKFFSENMFMFTGQKDFGSGTFALQYDQS